MSQLNLYHHCNDNWTLDNCDSDHNDRCPICDKEIEPYGKWIKSYEELAPCYEVTLRGFDGLTDETDHLVLHVIGKPTVTPDIVAVEELEIEPVPDCHAENIETKIKELLG